MKLRLRKNSIRLRLSPNDISRLSESGTVSEKIQFNQTQTLKYTVKISHETNDISVDFADAEIVAAIPFDTARNWTDTELIGLEHEQKIDDKLMLKITIEKDFSR